MKKIIDSFCDFIGLLLLIGIGLYIIFTKKGEKALEEYEKKNPYEPFI